MNRFATGLIAGGLMAAAGVSYMMSDSKTRKRAMKESKRAMRKAGDYFGGVMDKF